MVFQEVVPSRACANSTAQKRPLSRGLEHSVSRLSRFERLHGKAVRNAAIPFRVELLALRQTLVVWLHLWSCKHGEGTQTKDSEQQTQRSKAVEHGSRRKRAHFTFSYSCVKNRRFS